MQIKNNKIYLDIEESIDFCNDFSETYNPNEIVEKAAKIVETKRMNILCLRFLQDKLSDEELLPIKKIVFPRSVPGQMARLINRTFCTTNKINRWVMDPAYFVAHEWKITIRRLLIAAILNMVMCCLIYSAQINNPQAYLSLPFNIHAISCIFFVSTSIYAWFRMNTDLDKIEARSVG